MVDLPPAGRPRRRWLLPIFLAVGVALVLVALSQLLGTGSGDPLVVPSMSATPVPTDVEPTEYPTSSPVGSATTDPTTSPTQSPSRSPSADDEIAAFIRECRRSTTFRVGQVDFPKTFELRLGETRSYNAAVDVRAQPAPATRVIDAGDPREEPIKVQCVLSARLVPVGAALKVVASGDTDERGWMPRQFTPDGVVEWSWDISALEPRDQELRLELQPAVAVEDTSLSQTISTTASFVTPVSVGATGLERGSFWFKTQWPLVTGIAGAVGVAVLGILAFSTKARDALTALFKRSPPPAETKPRTSPSKSSKAATGKGRKKTGRRS